MNDLLIIFIDYSRENLIFAAEKTWKSYTNRGKTPWKSYINEGKIPWKSYICMIKRKIDTVIEEQL